MGKPIVRGKKLWFAFKDPTSKKWVNKRTGCSVGEEAEAQRYIDTFLKALAEGAAPTGPLTVKAYSERWLKERQEREPPVRSIASDIGRMRNHVLPLIGSMPLDQVKPKHIRDMVRALRHSVKANASVRNIYGLVRTMFYDACIDELIAASPCMLKRGELPSKVDGDPEWRAAAMYADTEIQQLISAIEIPPERRVLYALKAIAGLRHGEAAGLRWRHYDSTIEPLGRLVIATSYDTGRTKTGVTRLVPVHPTLAAILTAWRASHWERVYGRKPTPDDLVIPTLNMTPRSSKEAQDYLITDLLELKLRIDAGTKRHRGGHDMRSWFITTCQEHGAARDLIAKVTHASKKDVMAGYTRNTWAGLCAEVAKLKISTTDGAVLELAPYNELTVARKPSKRWRKAVTPSGLEPVNRAAARRM